MKKGLSKPAHHKSSIIFILLIVLILFFLWNAPSIEGPPIPNDEDHRNMREETYCMECHTLEELMKENLDHPPKTECLECHRKNIKPTNQT